ncbi:MAG: MogA/MoaB family molybdenum cofactor biosynthesis protein [Desulfuromonadales bacterium]
MSDTSCYSIGVLTLSDKGSQGKRLDESGRLASEILSELGRVSHYEILPDDTEKIVALLVQWIDEQGADLIVTTGGTGLSPRDITPEATQRVLDYEIPGIAEAMRTAGLAKTPHAMLSRAVAGVRGRSLILNLPGSPKGVTENLQVVLPALEHALKKLRGDPADCAR